MNESKDGLFGRKARNAVALLVAFLSVCAIPFAVRVPIDNRVERFLDPKSEDAVRYERFRDAFGNDEFVLVAYTGRDLFEEESLDLQLDALERIESLPHVDKVRGIPQVYRDLFGGEDPEALKEEFLSTPFYEGYMISEDASVGCCLVEISTRSASLELNLLVSRIREALQPLRDAGFELHLVGHPVLHAKMEEVTNREVVRTFPVALLCSVVVLVFLFRSLKATLVCLVCMTVTVLLTVGLMGLLGATLSMVTSSLPMLLWVLALANLIHILRRYEEDRAPVRSFSGVEVDDRGECPSHSGIRMGSSIESDIASALRQTALPCAVAMVTTAVGFLSLLAATMEPIRELGIFAAVGLLISLVVSLTLGPLLVEKLRVPGLGKRAEREKRWTLSLGRFSLAHRRVTLLLTAALLLLSLSCLPWVSLESNVLTFLPDDSDTVLSYDFVSERLTGLYALETMVHVPGGWLDEGVWPPLEALESQFERLGGEGEKDRDSVAAVVSPLDYLRKLNQWDHDLDLSEYRLPESGSEAERLLGMLDEEAKEDLSRLVTQDGKTLRFSILIRDTDSARFIELANQAKALLEGLPGPMSGEATGIVLQLSEMQLALVKTQARSLVLAFVSVFVCILIGLRSWRLTLVSVLPNLMPILCTFGAMAIAGIALNPATVMVASISLGIAVDDAIHVLNAYKRLRYQEELSPSDAVRKALVRVGPAITTTTLTACIGFFAMSRSAFGPIRYFGMLTGFAMVLALAGNLFLVPALVTLRWRSRLGE